jgi:DNA-binding CsgD family transcriptional regulator
MAVLPARASDFERDLPFGLILRLLEPTFARATESDRKSLFRGRAALAAPLLLGTGDETAVADTSEEFTLFHGLYWCLVNLSEFRPLVLLVDDVQIADELSLRFLVYLAERLEDLPVALIAASRTGDLGADSEMLSRLMTSTADCTLSPSALSLDGVRGLLDSAGMATEDRADLVRASWEVTSGNPLLVRELIAAFRHDAVSWLDATVEVIGRFAPESVGRRVMLRLAHLGTEALALARAGAVLGDGCSLSHAAALAGLEITRAVAAADRLSLAQILIGTDALSFAHPMIRHAVYNELPPAERSHAHADAAELLHREHAPVEAVARQLLASPPNAEPWAREALHEHARAAARKGAPSVAVRCLRRALEVSPPAERSPAMLVDLGIVEAASAEPTALARFEEALAVLDDSTERARALYALGNTLYRHGRYAEAAATLRRGVDLFRQHDRASALMFEGAFMAPAYHVASLYREAWDRLEALAPSLVEPRPLDPAERVLLAHLSFRRTMYEPPAAEAAALARRALEDGSLLRGQAPESMAGHMAIWALVFTGNAGEAQLAAEAMITDAQNRGAAFAFAEASLSRALALRARGQIADAAVDAHAAIDGAACGWREAGPAPQAVLGDCLIERGDIEGADAALRAASDALAPRSARVTDFWFLSLRGRLRLLKGDPQGALEDYLTAGTTFDFYGLVSPAISWRVPAGLAAHACGDHDRAIELISEERSLAERFGLPVQLGVALRALATVQGHTAGIEQLVQAIEILETVDAPLELARTLIDHGGGLRRQGHRVDSREPLRRAADLAHRCGATALERTARDELLASGARPRTAVLGGIEALTPSERRIANLVADGLTNREIAEALFLTKNTIEWHLRHVYQKLQLHSRAELSSAALNAPPS